MPGLVSEVCATLLGCFCGLGLLDARLTPGKSGSLYSKDDPKVKCWPMSIRIICRIYGLAPRCFLFTYHSNDGPLLTCQAIKIDSGKMDGCRKTDLFSKDVL